MSIALEKAKDVVTTTNKEIDMAATYLETTRNFTAPLALVQEGWREKASEYFWFSVCLVLFMILGPFAAPIALGFIFSKQATGADMTEPARIDE
ncbi:MAG: hypothetical protein V2J11_12160 [Desulfofustis sp.]|jgi:hypothetical protein|nr:hypothetical protein [Desulfofustis sp.]